MDSPAATDETALRASDADRERFATMLREHASQGRLTVDELEARLEQTYAARTRGELDSLTRDLPTPAPATSIAPRSTTLARSGGCGQADLRSFVAVNALLIAVWALTGAGYFWPIWPLLGWGAGIAAQRMKARTPRPPAAAAGEAAGSRR